MDAQIKETLEKQLQLLSERSKECTLNSDLRDLTSAMVQIAAVLR